MKVLYFSWVRDRIGVGSEDLSLPENVTSVEGLVEWLKGRGEGYQKAFDDITIIRVAINQEHVKLDHPVGDSDEVAFFPPVTGG
ncbi:MAG TPA: molybdopterin converting factor subunit 1 [Rhodospirillales bacterium]|nr:molybdopterin converting factor subunit 1 [Rhodospirillales bacterium]